MEEYIGIVKLFAGNFAPRGWMFCDGSLLSIAQNSALFSILGTTYGGDGRTTFALPNLKGRMALGAGTVNSSENYPLGIVSGTTQNTLLASNLPSIGGGFQLKVANKNANTSTPSAAVSIAITGTQVGRDFNVVPSFVNNANPDTAINGQSISFVGQNLPVNNMPPYLGLNYIICVEGIYPPRS
ncbi:phage tail protein [Chryseobacterium arthrosphaerae]|uniref:Phage tail protein n=1 Tax=Chryseobacterium arthrosphaerae TaxID=651561 RepID=A0A1B8Z9S8_9FLAO|nr:tail fiber protein [Chryseobacterium arthrosphaerae]AYZ10538.1 phage tail protein [Chryseobacterium arthrosphaerae]MDG4652089.1 tail fiber protein [Chryseobacterium arthrosphaerae]OCA68330.1 phage tail protein [Chryseobacterium arthrosphaerae]QUY55898.1 phage tail protein [Chryseobacterium arthrosphaerae]WES97057.1 tail fiber protein [Chryseobacterium arthrosphaerae]